MGSTESLLAGVEVPLSALVKVAIEAWRLERWCIKTGDAVSSGAVRHAARRLRSFLQDQQVEYRDLSGQPYDPGLAVEVVGVLEEQDGPDGYGLIEEMVVPMVLWRGTVVGDGQVVTRRRMSADTASADESEGA